MRVLRALAPGALLALAVGCGEPPGPPPEPSPSPPGRPRILVVGTSLTAGLGLPGSEPAYPDRLQSRIDSAGLAFEVVAAGVSGETSAGALSRVDWLLSEPVAVLAIETGANDGLRGQDPEALRESLLGIVRRAREQSPEPAIVLLGMRAPTNLGREYGERFAAVYAELARREDLTLVPFLLEGVAGAPALNQADGIHPNPAGHERMADNVWTVLLPLLRGLTTPAG